MISKNVKKNRIYSIIEVVAVFVMSLLMIMYVNRGVKILGLHLDDLNMYIKYLESPNLKSWIFDYDPLRMHYRPVFYTLLYIIHKIIYTDVSRVLIINFLINAGISTGIFYLVRSLKINRVLSFLVIVMYAFSNFSYYQIYQMIGIVEGIPLILSLTILISCIKSGDYSAKEFIRITNINLLLYFVMVFTHERYFPMLLLIIFSIMHNKNIALTDKKKYYIICLIELFLFFAIRYYFLRIIIPRGTDCNDLIANFDLKRSFKFIFYQIMYLLGINLGPRYLCGITYNDIEGVGTRIIIIIEALMAVLFFVSYYIKKKKEKDIVYIKNIDLYFIIYIFLCILQSSLTIRVELRWLYASFIAMLIYMSYILNQIAFTNYENLYKKNIFKVLLIAAFVVFYAGRSYINSYYKKNDIYIFIINEQMAVNSLVENTVNKYGIEELRDKTIYMTSNRYNTFSNFERYHFFDQFDNTLTDREMIIFTDTITDDIVKNAGKSIILLDEVGIREYKENLLEDFR